MYTTSDNVKLNWSRTRTHSPSHGNTLNICVGMAEIPAKKSYVYKSRLVETSLDFMELEDSYRYFTKSKLDSTQEQWNEAHSFKIISLLRLR